MSRTSDGDIRLRKPSLYPTELRGRSQNQAGKGAVSRPRPPPAHTHNSFNEGTRSAVVVGRELPVRSGLVAHASQLATGEVLRAGGVLVGGGRSVGCRVVLKGPVARGGCGVPVVEDEATANGGAALARLVKLGRRSRINAVRHLARRHHAAVAELVDVVLERAAVHDVASNLCHQGDAGRPGWALRTSSPGRSCWPGWTRRPRPTAQRQGAAQNQSNRGVHGFPFWLPAECPALVSRAGRSTPEHVVALSLPQSAPGVAP
jgi:hypothetical protein